MNVAIIGGGLTGLTAGYTLAKQGIRVNIFEKSTHLGGLAHGWKKPHWDWHLESAYHHLFTNDTHAIHLLNNLGLKDHILIKRPITANYWGNNEYQFDSPLHLLVYPGLTPYNRIRTGFCLASMKLWPWWRILESFTAKTLFITLGGLQGWKNIWEPLMNNKFATYADTVSATWLWARIKKRTPKLVYLRGGFQSLIDELATQITEHKGSIHKHTSITTVKPHNTTTKLGNKFQVLAPGRRLVFDAVLITTPSAAASTLVGSLWPSTYSKKLQAIPHLHAQTLILETKYPILTSAYWLNITQPSFPFLAVVAHTNFVNRRHYGGNHITYFGNYLPERHPYLAMNKHQLLKEFTPFIQKICPDFSTYNLQPTTYNLFTGVYAQPVHQKHYSHQAPTIQTPAKNIYLANIDSIYPWDRGINYAVKLGEDAADVIAANIR